MKFVTVQIPEGSLIIPPGQANTSGMTIHQENAVWGVIQELCKEIAKDPKAIFHREAIMNRIQRATDWQFDGMYTEGGAELKLPIRGSSEEQEGMSSDHFG